MNKKITLIMSDSKAYLHDETVRIYKEWGFSSSNVKTVEQWSPALVRNSVSLFGDVSMVHLDLSDKDKLKNFVALLTEKKTKDLFDNKEWFGAGLIISTIHAQGTKKVEDLVKKSGGDILKKAKPEEMRNLLMSRIHLNSVTKDFVESYIGENYSMLLSIVNQFEKISKEDQLAMTPDDLVVKLPIQPGAVPPWEFIDPMLEGNARKSIPLYERAMIGSHPLVAMLFARKKFHLMYRLKVLQKSGIWKSQDQAAAIGERNGPGIWITAKVAQNLDIQTVEYLAKLSLVTEANLKGHLNADPNLVFKNFIATSCLAIKYNKVMPLDIR